MDNIEVLVHKLERERQKRKEAEQAVIVLRGLLEQATQMLDEVLEVG